MQARRRPATLQCRDRRSVLDRTHSHVGGCSLSRGKISDFGKSRVPAQRLQPTSLVYFFPSLSLVSPLVIIAWRPLELQCLGGSSCQPGNFLLFPPQTQEPPLPFPSALTLSLPSPYHRLLAQPSSSIQQFFNLLYEQCHSPHSAMPTPPPPSPPLLPPPVAGFVIAVG